MREPDSSTDTPYVPIACSDYDIYEIAIMRRQQLRLTIKGNDSLQVTPVSLRIEQGAEYLEYTINKTLQRVRLDQIERAQIIE